MYDNKCHPPAYHINDACRIRNDFVYECLDHCLCLNSTIASEKSLCFPTTVQLTLGKFFTHFIATSVHTFPK